MVGYISSLTYILVINPSSLIIYKMMLNNDGMRWLCWTNYKKTGIILDFKIIFSNLNNIPENPFKKLTYDT